MTMDLELIDISGESILGDNIGTVMGEL